MAASATGGDGRGAIPPLDTVYEDDPRVVKEAATEDYSLHVVPRSWRSSRGSLSMAWLALFSAMFWLIFAATIALAVGTIDALIGLALAVIAMGGINAIITRYAARSGMTVALFSRSIFGYVGAALAALIFGATAIYYATFEGSVIAIAFDAYFGGISLNLWYLVVVLYSVPLVFGGVQVWLDKFNGVLLPFYIIGLVVVVVWAIAEFGYSGEWFTYAGDPAVRETVSGPGWVFAFTVTMGVWIMMMYTWDYARFSRKSDEKFHANWTFGMPFYLATLLVNGVIGIFLALTIPVDEISEISVVLGIVGLTGLAGIVLIWVSQTRINTANFYLASSNLQSFFARTVKLHLPRWVWAIIVGGIVYAIMLTNIFTFILEALRYQGVVIVAWVGIALMHIASRKVKALNPEEEFRPGRVPLVNPGGLISWLVASAVGIVLLEAVGAWGVTWSALITFVVAGGCYALSLLVAQRGWFALDRPYDPRTEVEDTWEARIMCSHCHRRYIALEMDRDPGHGHAPICAACASESRTFYRNAHAEAKRAAAEPPKEETPAAV